MFNAWGSWVCANKYGGVKNLTKNKHYQWRKMLRNLGCYASCVLFANGSAVCKLPQAVFKLPALLFSEDFRRNIRREWPKDRRFQSQLGHPVHFEGRDCPSSMDRWFQDGQERTRESSEDEGRWISVGWDHRTLGMTRMLFSGIEAHLPSWGIPNWGNPSWESGQVWSPSVPYLCCRRSIRDLPRPSSEYQWDRRWMAHGRPDWILGISVIRVSEDLGEERIPTNHDDPFEVRVGRRTQSRT